MLTTSAGNRDGIPRVSSLARLGQPEGRNYELQAQQGTLPHYIKCKRWRKISDIDLEPAHTHMCPHLHTLVCPHTCEHAYTHT